MLISRISTGLTDTSPQTGIKPRYIPYGSALAAWESTETEVLLSGAAGTGKSRAWLEKMHHCAETYEGMRGLIVRKTRTSLSETGLQTFEDYVLPPNHPARYTGSRKPPERRNRQVYRYPNGSEIVVGGMDNSNRILSAEYDMIFIQEGIELSITDYEDLTTRIGRRGAMPYAQIGIDTNPGHPQHWLKKRCDAGVTRLVKCRHEDNPILYDHEAGQWTERGLRYLAILDNLTGIRKKRKRFGLWVQSEGAVYEEFDENIHVIDRFEVPDDWPRYMSIDFGYTNPFVAQWWTADPDGRLILYREIYMSRKTVRAHAETIKRLETGLSLAKWNRLDSDEKMSQWRNSIEYRRCLKRWADHDAEDRATLTEEGITTETAKKDLSRGIEAMQHRLAVAGDGKPRLMLMRDSLVELDTDLKNKELPASTFDEFPAYMWPEGKDGKPEKETPLDLYNHGMDAARYLVMGVDKPTGFDPEIW